MKNPIIEVKNLGLHFGPASRPVRAVDGVSFSIDEGETVALVGESGCGKSVTALSLAKLVSGSSRYVSGSVMYDGKDVLQMEESELRWLRGNEISFVFQEPGMSLNPVFRVGSQIAEAIRLHRKGVDVHDEVLRLLQLVGIPAPEKRMRSYPHEMSGGMQQRVMIAMALACQPRLLVADEPTTALDVTIQAQILELLSELQKQLGMAILLITHNLGLVADVAHSVNVMYAGRIVERGPSRELLRNPEHPYTHGLLAAVPRLTGSVGRLKSIDGSVPHLAQLPSGCKFHPRCPKRKPDCEGVEPELRESGENRAVRCYYPVKQGQHEER
ncbi:MAG: ABC transporter ATP-binding protein [Verrucomicrobia bacterium]|nr:ABC transporter ATP-binding protein [Verrucomicrobiota bacterium]